MSSTHSISFVRRDKTRQDATCRHLSLKQKKNIRSTTTHDSRQAPADRNLSAPHNKAIRQATAGRDLSGGAETEEHIKLGSLSAVERELYERMITYLEEQRADLAKDKELLQSDKEMLMRQLEAKDKQIDRFFESERDTKTLAGRFQSLMTALWSKKGNEGGERYVPMHDALDSGLERTERDDYDAGR